MPSRARNVVIRPDEVGVYHCWSRCVRRAFLCGKDAYTGKDYEYRREWIERYEEFLASQFAIEVGFHAELSNHLHLVLRNRPDIVETWSDEEVVGRWLRITHSVKSDDGQPSPIPEARVNEILGDAKQLKAVRQRLADPSWFMASLCEHVSRRSNAEDGVSGSFWEDRFDCRALVDEAAILVCGIYVDLNQIRAGEALTPETSTHTSARQRISSLQGKRAGEHEPMTAPDGWLCELTIDELAAPNASLATRSATGRRASDKGLLPLSTEEYLELLDASGRMVHQGKASIPNNIAPILERLGIDKSSWCDVIVHFNEWFGHIVGSTKQLAARALQTNRRWFRGASRCASVFG